MQLIDSNVLIYAYDASDKKKHEIAKNILKNAWNKKIDYAISVQNLSEFFYVVTEKRKIIPRKEAQDIIMNLTSSGCLHLFSITEASIRLGAAIAASENVHFFDALLGATMKENYVKEIITEDIKDFEKIPGIKVINPFK